MVNDPNRRRTRAPLPSTQAAPIAAPALPCGRCTPSRRTSGVTRNSVFTWLALSGQIIRSGAARRNWEVTGAGSKRRMPPEPNIRQVTTNPSASGTAAKRSSSRPSPAWITRNSSTSATIAHSAARNSGWSLARVSACHWIAFFPCRGFGTWVTIPSAAKRSSSASVPSVQSFE